MRNNYKSNIKAFIKREDGMTLIDLAIALMVIGILITPVLFSIRTFSAANIRNTNASNIGSVNDAIERFYLANGFLPCPANPTLNRTAANHGVSDSTGSATAPFCNRDEGSVPHQTLGLHIDDIYDGWGHKLLYVMTDDLADPAGASGTTPGAIQVQEVNIISHPVTCLPVCANLLSPYPGPIVNPCDPPNTYPATPLSTINNITYTVLSHGQDAVGAYTEGGTLIPGPACNDSSATDQENCDGDRVFISNENACLTNNNNTTTKYDDIILSGTTSLIANTSGDRRGIPSRIFEERAAGQIGSTVSFTGINNDNPQRELDIIGDVLITDTNAISGDGGDGSARSDNFCSVSNPTECFKANLIGGNDPNMQCAGNTVMVAIGSNQARCARQFSATATTAPCPTGQYVVSLSANGGAVCGP